MKIKNKFLPILLFVIILFTSCKKDLMNIDNISIYNKYYLLNKTNDTLKCYYYYTENKYYFTILYPNQKLETPFINDYVIYYPDEYTKYYINTILIYHIEDTNNIYIKFKRNENPYNYKLNYFNEDDWEKNHSYNTEIKDGWRYYKLYKNYTFTISNENIINLN
jgi:hypothetical protein